jgi:UDP:flavonoid glycosyltransferase YjiC (YdhE family)
VRILFTFAGGSGHLDPLVPFARAAVTAGHDVAFAGRPWMAPVVEALGFAAFGTGSDIGLAPVRRPLVPVDMEREASDLRDGFAGRIAGERATDLLPLFRSWQPDVLVCEETDFGPMVVAERLGIPHATVVVLAAGGLMRHEVLGEPLDALRATYDLPPDPDLAMVRRHLVLSPFPPSLRDPAFPLPSTAHAIRPAALAGSTPVWQPSWPVPDTRRPLAYVTLGTVFPLESGDLFARLLDGLQDLPLDVVVTVGRDLDPAELGPRPANVHVESYIPQAAILPWCDLVVSHGGSGSVAGALAFGRPMVIVPMGADQPLNAARCRDLGVARVLDPIAATPAEVRDAVAEVISEPGYLGAARRLRGECLALPGPEHGLALIEAMACG